MKKMLIFIFGRIWFVWFLIVFFSDVIVLYPLIFFAPTKHAPKNVRYIAIIYSIFSNTLCYLSLFRVKLVGRSNYQPQAKYIIVANHRSVMDIPITAARFSCKIIAKKNFFMSIPLFSTYYKKGTILVDRQSLASRTNSFEMMKKVLENDICMCIYPEGTRNKTKDTSVLPFQNGAFRLSKETLVPILPVVLFNTDKAVSITIPFFAMPTQIQIHILPAVYPNDFATMKEMREAVHNTIKTYYEAHQPTIAKATLFQY